MFDGYFSASHQRRDGQSEEKSVLDKVFYHSVNANLESEADAEAGCASNFVAARKDSASNKRNDINGIFGSMCHHGCMEDIAGKLLGY